MSRTSFKTSLTQLFVHLRKVICLQNTFVACNAFKPWHRKINFPLLKKYEDLQCRLRQSPTKNFFEQPSNGLKMILFSRSFSTFPQTIHYLLLSHSLHY